MVTFNVRWEDFTGRLLAPGEITERKINHFSTFEPGWYYGEGRAFDPLIVEDALALNKAAVQSSFFETDAFPGTDGELVVTVYIGEHNLEFSIRRDRSIVFCQEFGNQELKYEEGLTLQEAEARIVEFRRETWSQFALYQGTIMIGDSEGSTARPLVTQEMIRASQLLEEAASTILKEQSVSTSASSTEGFIPIPQSSGALPRQPYPMDTD
jgi:hypothetical protein